MHRGRSKEAIVDFEKATTLDPTSSGARAGLAVAEAWSGDEAVAASDLDKAAALDPKEPLVYEGHAILAQKNGKAAEAVAAYGQALELDPGDELAREQRSVLEALLGRTDAALADTAELLRSGADPLAARLLRVQIYAARHQLDDALKEADAAVRESPDSAEAYVLRGVVLAKQGKVDDAQAQVTRSLTLRPTPEAYVTRARYRVATDYAGKLADINAALALDANVGSILLLRADTEAQAGTFDKAIADADSVVGAEPANASAHLERARILVEAGRPNLAAEDFAWVRAQAKQSSVQWNQLCWTEAPANISLDLALTDCEFGSLEPPHPVGLDPGVRQAAEQHGHTSE
jgi:Flp pilus assembly protein TadD